MNPSKCCRFGTGRSILVGKATALNCQMGKISVTGMLSFPTLSWLHFHSMTWQNTTTVCSLTTQFAKPEEYMGVELVLCLLGSKEHIGKTSI